MAEEPNEPERAPRPPKGCLSCLAVAFCVYLLWSLLFPSISWTGAAWLTIHVQVVDAATNQPIPNATVTLTPDPPVRVDERFPPPFALSAQTDSNGRATLKHMFGAGGGSQNWHSNTNIVVGSSHVRCEAPGYVSSEIRVNEAGKVQFRGLFFREPSNQSTELSITLRRQ